MWKPDICIHHFPCPDGFAAAWIIQRKWPDVVAVGTNYGEPVPNVEMSGKNLLIADFSYNPQILSQLAGRASAIVVLDHHKTADADLRDVKRIVGGTCENVQQSFDAAGVNMLAEFDMDRSGATLAWQFCFPREHPPLLIKYIEDRDLWRMRLEHSSKVATWLQSYPYDFTVWTGLMEQFEDANNRRGFVSEAEGIERFYNQKIAEIVRTATFKKISDWNGIPVAHAPRAFASDVGNALLRAHPGAPFVAVVVHASDTRSYSLRSDDTRQDVSEVARKFGGGGHRNAASFRVPDDSELKDPP